MTLPPADHPIWKLLQTVVCVVGLAVLTMHGVDGGHGAGLDVEDVSGGVGALAGANLLRQLARQWLR